MKRLAASFSLAFFIASPALAHHHTGCAKLFSIHMDKRAALVIYRGTREVTLKNLRLLGYLERCQRNPRNQAIVRTFNRNQDRLWKIRKVQSLPVSMYPVVASWYDDSGSTACGFHATYGVANKTLPCGSHVLLRHGGNSVTATVEDRGPFISGRSFDLNPQTKAALGCSDLCSLLASATG